MAAAEAMKLLTLIACVVLVASTEAATVGTLDERGLMFHEAWAEARLSMDHTRLEQEWLRLVDYLKASLHGKARVRVTGNAEDWVVELKPLNGPMMVRVDRSGARVMAAGGTGTVEARTLLLVYPWRRHYDCEGRALNPSRPGVPVRGKPCTAPAGMTWRVVAEPASENDGAVVQPVPGLPGCYRVVSESGGVLTPGQILVEDGKRYALEKMSDDKLRVRYRENRRLFVMSEKQPAGDVIEW